MILEIQESGVAVITKPTTKKKVEKQSKTEKEPSWRVLLHNDDVHTFEYVTGAIVKVRFSFFFLFFGIINFFFSSTVFIANHVRLILDLSVSNLSFVNRLFELLVEKKLIELQCKLTHQG